MSVKWKKVLLLLLALAYGKKMFENRSENPSYVNMALPSAVAASTEK